MWLVKAWKCLCQVVSGQLGAVGQLRKCFVHVELRLLHDFSFHHIFLLQRVKYMLPCFPIEFPGFLIEALAVVQLALHVFGFFVGELLQHFLGFRYENFAELAVCENTLYQDSYSAHVTLAWTHLHILRENGCQFLCGDLALSALVEETEGVHGVEVGAVSNQSLSQQFQLNFVLRYQGQ